MRTKRGSKIIIEELGLVDLEEFQDRLEIGESLKEICAQLHLFGKSVSGSRRCVSSYFCNYCGCKNHKNYFGK